MEFSRQVRRQIEREQAREIRHNTPLVVRGKRHKRNVPKMLAMFNGQPKRPGKVYDAARTYVP